MPNSLVPSGVHPRATASRMIAPQRYRMVRVPISLYVRLAQLAKEIGAAKEAARGYDDVPFAEQGARGTWVPLHALISRALDEFENKRTRSRGKRTKRTKTI